MDRYRPRRPRPGRPVGPLLALPAWLVDHLPLLPDPGSAAGLVVAILVVLAMPLAAVSTYVALRPVVATRWVRGLAAFAWASTGVASAAVAQGRLGALVALILLPPTACGLWLLAIRRSTVTSACATALAAVLLGAFAPVLLAVVSALAMVLAVFRSRVRRHALVVALVPMAVLAPWFVRQAEVSWPVLVAGAGLAQWGGPAPEPWQLALLSPGGAGAPLVWTAAPLVALAVLAFLRGRAWGSATTTLALLAPALLALALLAPGIRLGTVPAGVDGAGEPIMLWSGLMLLPFVLVLVLALARGLDGMPPPGDGRRWSRPHPRVARHRDVRGGRGARLRRRRRLGDPGHRARPLAGPPSGRHARPGRRDVRDAGAVRHPGHPRGRLPLRRARGVRPRASTTAGG